MTKALITGNSGQDGGYLAEQLAGEGYEVHGVIRAAEALPEHLRALGDTLFTHEVDLLDEPTVVELVARVAPDEVYSLAGLSSVAQSWTAPIETVTVNGVAVAVLLEALWQHQERSGVAVRLVHASSAEMFAGTTAVPQDERTPLSPRSPYGASKALAHHLVSVYRARGLHASTAILYNHESPRRPDSFVTRKITSTVAAIAAGRADRLVLGSTSARRDWGWAPEYVDALVRAARHPQPDDYVVATGESHSVREFVAEAFAAADIADWQNLVVSDEPAFSRPGDAVDLVGDPAHTEAVLGWRAEVRFSQVVRRMVEHDRAVLD